MKRLVAIAFTLIFSGGAAWGQIGLTESGIDQASSVTQGVPFTNPVTGKTEYYTEGGGGSPQEAAASGNSTSNAGDGSQSGATCTTNKNGPTICTPGLPQCYSQGGGDACSKAVSACNAIPPAAQAAIQTILGQASSTLATGASGNVACQIGEDLSGVMSIGNLALAASCEIKVHTCTSTIKTAQSSKNCSAKAGAGPAPDPDCSKLAKDLNTCNSQQGMAALSAVQALSYVQSAANDAQCVAYWKAVNAAANATPKPCSERPNDADCVCVLNPRNPTCFGYGGGAASGVAANMGMNSSGNAGDPSLGDSTGLGQIPGPGAQPPGQIPGANGGAGGGGPALTGAGKLAAEDQGSQAPGPYKTDIINGTTSGTGGNPYASKGADGSGSGDNSSMLSRLAAGLNLKKFLPGSAYKNRGPASVDGLTGANGPTLFEKVSSRYAIKKGEMTP